MDAIVMQARLEQWLPIFEAQAQSGLCKKEWCELNGIKRHEFFKWQRIMRQVLLSEEMDTRDSACPDKDPSSPSLDDANISSSAEVVADTQFVEVRMSSCSTPSSAGQKTTESTSLGVEHRNTPDSSRPHQVPVRTTGSIPAKVGNSTASPACSIMNLTTKGPPKISLPSMKIQCKGISIQLDGSIDETALAAVLRTIRHVE